MRSNIECRLVVLSLPSPLVILDILPLFFFVLACLSERNVLTQYKQEEIVSVCVMPRKLPHIHEDMYTICN